MHFLKVTPVYVIKMSPNRNPYEVKMFFPWQSSYTRGIRAIRLIYKSPTLCVSLHKFCACYLLLQFSTDFYKIWFSGICMCQRLHIFIFIKIFAFLRPLWPLKPRGNVCFITALLYCSHL